MNGWGEFTCASAIFLASHSLPARPAIRGALTRRLGRTVYLVIYSTVSLILLAWLIAAARRAPYVGLWHGSQAQTWIANILMALAILLAVGGIAIANPFSLGGLASKAYDPARPGALAITRHPLLWALALWSLAHTLVNGDLAHVLLFGVMGLFSALGILMMERRARMRLSGTWTDQVRHTSLFPFLALLTGKARWREALQLRLLLAPLIWLIIVALHRPVLGVSPLPVF